MTRVRMLRFTKSQGIIKILFKFDIILFRMYWSTSVPKIIKIELSLTKLLQK